MHILFARNRLDLAAVFLMALFGTWKVLRKENTEENREGKWKERNFGGK